MSLSTFKNSIKNLVDTYIPEAFETADSRIEVPPGDD